MAGVGLSKPYFAIYSSNETTVAYSGGGLMGKFTELSISLNEGTTNALYADNGPAEQDNQFNGGTVSMSTDELSPENLTSIFGAKKESAGGSGGASWYVWDDDQAIPYVAIGGIIKKKINGVVKWVAYVLPKVQFKTPGIAATTQGETISWQTQSLNADILRSDEPKHRWYQLSSYMETEAEAEALIKAYLNIS